MVKIIFSRIGKKNRPQYRIVAIDKHKDPWGHALEILGKYNPRTKELTLKAESIKNWLANGAQPSATVHNLLVENKVIDDKKVRVSTISKNRAKKLQEKKKQAEKVAAEPPKAEDKPAASAEKKPDEKKS